MRFTAIFATALALSGCSQIDYHNPVQTAEANFHRQVAAMQLEKSVRHDLYPVDRDLIAALAGERIESPGFGLFAKTVQGRSVDRANIADMVSTVAALARGATEMNPLGIGLVIPKLVLGPYVDRFPCWQRAGIAGKANAYLWGLFGNNMAVALTGATAGVTIPVGIATGTIYYAYRTAFEPGVYSCINSGE